MSVGPAHDPGAAPRLLDLLLAEQGTLSAVDVFAQRTEEGALPLNGSAYQDLIPLHRVPRPGQQLAFRVDLDACTGCKACVTACHSLNGLAPEETWRDVGLLVGANGGVGIQQTVTTACHHCEDPACLAGCPVRAYEKDPVTGIVRHLDDQCIGCQYCVLKCPYDVPQYQPELGIVRKCDMCTGRLAAGEAPACVQGCPSSAISIQIVDQRGAEAVGELLPGVNGTIPDSSYTRPTTRYASKRLSGALRPADLDHLEPASAHDPLAVNLVLLQLSVGTLLFDAALGVLASPSAQPLRLLLAALSALSGLGAATLHLGRPLYAFRAFLGWRTSWMSREIIAFGAYVPALLAALAASGLVHVAPLAALAPAWLVGGAAALRPALAAAALALGIAGTFCSVMIYVDTRRAAWALARTLPAFTLTLVGLGALGAALVTALAAHAVGSEASGVIPLALLGLLALGLKIGGETHFLLRPRSDPRGALARSVRLLRGALRRRARARFVAAAAGGLLAAAALGSGVLGLARLGLGFGTLSFVVFVLGELIERHLYFTSEASCGMPGG